MINQRAYPDVILGFGNSSQTFALFGCFVASILDALNTRYGYNYTVTQFNQLLKDRDAFVRPNLISASRLAEKLSDIFLEGRNEAWNDAKIISYLNDTANYLVIGEVSGKGIGGSGQHFVKIDALDVSGGQVTMTYIDDPWGGLENQRVTTRYNAYGNILSLRVFKIKRKNTTTPPSGGNMMYQMKSGNKVDLSNMESNKVLANVYDEVIHQKIYLKIAEFMDTLIPVNDPEGQRRTPRWYMTEWHNRKDQVSRLEGEKTAIQKAFDQYKLETTTGTETCDALRRADQELIATMDAQAQEQGKVIGALQHKNAELEETIATQKQQIVDLQNNSLDSLTVYDVLVMLVNKLRGVKLK